MKLCTQTSLSVVCFSEPYIYSLLGSDRCGVRMDIRLKSNSRKKKPSIPYTEVDDHEVFGESRAFCATFSALCVPNNRYWINTNSLHIFALLLLLNIQAEDGERQQQ